MSTFFIRTLGVLILRSDFLDGLIICHRRIPRIGGFFAQRGGLHAVYVCTVYMAHFATESGWAA
jgi:hypothetical protein